MIDFVECKDPMQEFTLMLLERVEALERKIDDLTAKIDCAMLQDKYNCVLTDSPQLQFAILFDRAPCTKEEEEFINKVVCPCSLPNETLIKDVLAHIKPNNITNARVGSITKAPINVSTVESVSVEISFDKALTAKDKTNLLALFDKGLSTRLSSLSCIRQHSATYSHLWEHA